MKYSSITCASWPTTQSRAGFLQSIRKPLGASVYQHRKSPHSHSTPTATTQSQHTNSYYTTVSTSVSHKKQEMHKALRRIGLCVNEGRGIWPIEFFFLQYCGFCDFCVWFCCWQKFNRQEQPLYPLVHMERALCYCYIDKLRIQDEILAFIRTKVIYIAHKDDIMQRKVDNMFYVTEVDGFPHLHGRRGRGAD